MKKGLITCIKPVFADGRNDGIRTHDLLVPNQTHYQAVLRPDALGKISSSARYYATLERKIKEGHLIGIIEPFGGAYVV